MTVTANPSVPGDVNGGSARTLGSEDLRDFAGHVADDPLRMVQALPGVAGGDDFRSDYSVRGSPYHTQAWSSTALSRHGCNMRRSGVATRAP